MSLFGEVIHNFIGREIVTKNFLTSVSLGLGTILAIIFHKIPQEIGDFSIPVYGGIKPRKALFFNYLCSLTAVAGALTGYFFNSQFVNMNNFILAFAAGVFIYISCSDLMPELHKERNLKSSLVQVILILLGIGLIWFVHLFA